MNSLPIFELVASSISVCRVQSALCEVGLSDSFWTLDDRLETEWEARRRATWPSPVLVLDHGIPFGWIHPFDVDADHGQTIGPEDQIRDHAEWLVHPITVADIVSASTPVLDAALLFGMREPMEMLASLPGSSGRFTGFFFVLEDQRITGLLRWGDIFRAPGRLCLLTLSLELEEAALLLCSRFAHDCWGALPDGRRQRAQEVHSRRFEEPLDRYVERLRAASGDTTDISELHLRRLLDCTSFIDKATMIKECNLIASFSDSEIMRTFDLAQRIRNACAHPAVDNDLSLMVSRDDLARFINDSRLMIEEIKRLTP